MATQIEEEIPELPIPPYKNVDSGATFVEKAEAFRQALKDVFQPAMNYVINKINIISNEVSANTIIAENSAIIASGLANFKGVWSGIVVYSKGESVESTTGSKIYYTSKVDNNLNHSVTDTNYWLYNPINDKLNKDFSLLTDKETLIDTDILVIRETEGLLKKLSWANLKNTLKTYFDTLYITLTGNQTIAGDKSFTGNLLLTGASSVIGYGVGSGGAVVQATSKSTSVTLNKPTGQITMNNAALAANTGVAFVLYNSLISSSVIVNVSVKLNSVSYSAEARATQDGYALIYVKNETSGTLSESVPLIFGINKGAIA